MSGFEHFWTQGDAITRTVAVVLLLMSISAWVVIFWKAWLLHRVRKDIERAVGAFWAAPDLATAGAQLHAFDRERVLAPLLQAATATPNAWGGGIGAPLIRLSVAVASTYSFCASCT